MNVRRTNRNSWAVVGCAALLLIVSSHVLAQSPAHESQPAPAAAGQANESFDPMDSLLEFSGTPLDEQPPAAETNELLLLVRESSDIRDPFWPVGYEPPKAANTAAVVVVETIETPVVQEEPRWEEALREVTVKGIMSVGGGRFMAVVNGQIVGEKDMVSVSYGTRRYSWRINSITAQGVKFQKLTSTR